MDDDLAARLGDPRAAVIGIAIGILVERIPLTDTEAYESLMRLAADQGRSELDVASEIVETRGINRRAFLGERA